MDGIDSEQALAELVGMPNSSPAAPRAPREKVNYTHADMVDFIIANPGISQNAIALRYGYTPGWVSQMLSSDALQELIIKRRAEIIDPILVAQTEERFRMLANRSLEVLQKKIEEPTISPTVLLRCAELGAKALGLGGHAPPKGPELPEGSLDRLAQRLINLNREGAIPGTAVRVEE